MTLPTTESQAIAASPALRAWWTALALLGLTWAGIVALLYPSAASMVSIWDRSETYAHGWVILPLALWLVWRRREQVLATATRPDGRALVVIATFGCVWLVARLAGVQVGEHYALVGLLIASVWALFGWRLVWVLLFPLFYLLFMVPSGEQLTGPLINFTADFTVHTLRLLGFPVYREGTFFSLPSGDWSVVEACSGIRYFLAAQVLGWLYAYPTYRTWWKRVAFGIACIIVPVVANGFRAVMIVLIGHYSDMKLAVGVDHFIYGWVWFGIVMITLFWIGNHWREDHLETARPSTPPEMPVQVPQLRAPWLMAGLVIAGVAVFPFYERLLDSRPPTPSPLEKFTPAAGWQPLASPFTDWAPHWRGMDDQRAWHLGRDGHSAMLYLAWYGTQRQGAELINSQNVLVPEHHETWRKPSETGRDVTLATGAILPVREAILHATGSGQRLLVWYWNRVAGTSTTSGGRAKLSLAWRQLSGNSDAGAVVIIAAPYLETPAEAEATLLRFVGDQEPGLNAVLDGGMR